VVKVVHVVQVVEKLARVALGLKVGRQAGLGTLR